MSRTGKSASFQEAVRRRGAVLPRGVWVGGAFACVALGASGLGACATGANNLGGAGGEGTTTATHGSTTHSSTTSKASTTGSLSTGETTGATTSATTTTSTTSATTTTTSATTTSSTTSATTSSTTTSSTTVSSSSSSASSTGSGTTACTEAEQCGDTSVNVCSPKSDTCVPAECSASLACSGTDVCYGQITTPTVGACYTACTIFGSGCVATDTCLPANPGTTEGACYNTGTSALNATCTQSDTGTDCVAGALCVDDPPAAGTKCRKICSFFAGGSGCSAGQKCTVFDSCTAQAADSSALNGFCGANAVQGDPCGASGNIDAGVCIDTGLGSLECLKWCRQSGNDCSAGYTCTQIFNDATIEAGVCY